MILDTETTGLEPESSQVLELGAILYSVEYRCTLQQMSTLLPVIGDNPAEAVNKINVEATRTDYNFSLTLELFRQFHHKADYVVAHNAEFDRKWFGRGTLPPVTKPWLCTCDDFLWPKAIKRRPSLVNLVLEYGIGVNNIHRALSDCHLISLLFDRVDNFEDLLIRAIERSQEPQYFFIAEVSYGERDLAKSRGFRWNQYVKNKWAKRMRESDFAVENSSEKYPFEVTTAPVVLENSILEI